MEHEYLSLLRTHIVKTTQLISQSQRLTKSINEKKHSYAGKVSKRRRKALSTWIIAEKKEEPTKSIHAVTYNNRDS